MVDRIVPATTDADRRRISAALGVADAWPVIAEPFTQWVVEENFPQGRPAWETTGVELVREVRPYEDMKLRLLNGSHSTIAYLGQLAGWRTVADAIAEPALADHVAALMTEVAATLKLPPQVDVAVYRRSLIARFGNPALEHLTAQIAMDGSQKLPQRLLAPARELLARGASVRRIALGLAAWLRTLQGRSDNGVELPLSDPMADPLRAAARGADGPRALLDAVFALPWVVPPDLTANEPLRAEVLAALQSLTALGAKSTLQRWRTG
jgi:fructuronate reductase